MLKLFFVILYMRKEQFVDQKVRKRVKFNSSAKRAKVNQDFTSPIHQDLYLTNLVFH